MSKSGRRLLPVECDTIDRAVEIASRFPDTRYGATEARPIIM